MGIRTILQFSTSLILASPALACIWQPSPAVRYWPSTSIQVCFISQNMEAQTTKNLSFSSDLGPTRQTIIQAIQEMTNKTRFNFSGFSECDPNNTSPMVRIKIDRSMRGEALSIGPESSQRPHNLEVSQLPIETSQTTVNEMTGEIQTQNYVDELKWTAQHELMHLLGFNHDMERGSKSWNSFEPTIRSGSIVDPTYDRDSIMASGKGLSPRDIQCVNRLAVLTTRNAQVRSNNSTLPSSTPATREAHGVQ